MIFAWRLKFAQRRARLSLLLPFTLDYETEFTLAIPTVDIAQKIKRKIEVGPRLPAKCATLCQILREPGKKRRNHVANHYVFFNFPCSSLICLDGLTKFNLSLFQDDTRIMKVGDKKRWIHDPNSELFATIHYLYQDFVLTYSCRYCMDRAILGAH